MDATPRDAFTEGIPYDRSAEHWQSSPKAWLVPALVTQLLVIKRLLTKDSSLLYYIEVISTNLYNRQQPIGVKIGSCTKSSSLSFCPFLLQNSSFFSIFWGKNNYFNFNFSILVNFHRFCLIKHKLIVLIFWAMP